MTTSLKNGYDFGKNELVSFRGIMDNACYQDELCKWSKNVNSDVAFMVIPEQASKIVSLFEGIIFLNDSGKIICGAPVAIRQYQLIDISSWTNPNVVCPDNNELEGRVDILNENHGALLYDFDIFNGRLCHIKRKTNIPVSELVFGNSGCVSGVLVDTKTEKFVYEAYSILDVIQYEKISNLCNGMHICVMNAPCNFMSNIRTNYTASRREDWIFFEESEEFMNANKKIEESRNETKKLSSDSEEMSENDNYDYWDDDDEIEPCIKSNEE